MAALRSLGFEIDPARRELRRDGRRVGVQRRTLDLICYLASQAGRTVSREELIERVWDGTHVSAAALDRAVSAARRALDDTGRQQRVIRTQRGHGYRWIAPIERSDAAAPSEASGPALSGEDFVGRRRELAVADAFVREAAAGRGGVLLISGEPGIGKTRLASAIAARAREHGAAVAVGRCPEGEGAPPYWPWMQVLRDVLPADTAQGRPIAPHVAAVLFQAMPELAPQLPEAREAASPEPLSGLPARLRLYDQLRLAWRELSEERPLLLHFDDVHCADDDSLELLSLLAGEAAALRLLLVVTYRDVLLPADPSLSARIGALARSERARSLPLRGLDLEEVRALVRSVAGCPLDDGELRALYERTGGNPFFLTQVLRGGATRAADDPGLSAAVRRHLLIVSEATRSRLAAAAVLGRRFELPALAAVLDEDIAGVAAALDEARGANLLEGPEPGGTRHRFVHALIAEQLVDGLSARERRRQHARAARVLAAQRGPDARGEAAFHAVRALPELPAEEALGVCLAASEAASARLAWGEAVRRLGDAREVLEWLPDDPPRRLELVLRTGEAELRRGRLDRARACFEQAAQQARGEDVPEAFARAAVGYAGELDDARTDERSIALLEEAVVRMDEARSPWTARVKGRLAESLYHGEASLERASRLGSEALALARALDDEELLCEALRMRLWSGYSPDNLDEREKLAAELLERTRARSNTVLEHDARTYRIAASLERGVRAHLDLEVDAYCALRRRADHPILDFFGAHYDAMRALLGGDLARAEPLIFAGFERGTRTGYSVAITWFSIQIWGLRREQGRVGELETAMRDLAREYPVTPWRFALAEHEVRCGHRESGRVALADLESRGVERARRDLSWAALLYFAAHLCHLLGARETAAAVYRALQPFAGRHAQVGLGMLHLGSVDHALGRAAAAAGDLARAERHLLDAERAEARLGARAAVLRSRLEAARAAGASGRREAARERLATVLRRARAAGLVAIAAETEAALAAV